MTDMVKFFKAEIENDHTFISGQSSCSLGYHYSVQGWDKLGGVWAKWQWQDNVLTIENDRFGYYPLFYYYDDKKIIVSNSIAQIITLGGRSEYDEVAMAVFCRTGYFLNETTAFKYIKALPPGAKIQWQQGKMSIDGGPVITEQKDWASEQVVDGYIENFRQAIGRTLPDDNFVLPLSGGRDSRQILFELIRQGYRPDECITCGESRDIRATNIIADRLKLKHTLVRSNPRWVKDTVDKNELTQFCAIEHSWLMCLGRYLTENFNQSYDGTGIGIFTRSDFLTDEALSLYNTVQDDKFTDWLFEDIYPSREAFRFLPEKFRFINDRHQDAVEACKLELKRFDAAANPLASFNFYNGNRRAIAMNPFGIQSELKVLTPFLDYDLYDFISSVGPAVIKDAEPQTLAIKKAFPQYADIPFYDEFKKQPVVATPKTTKILNKIDLVKTLKTFSPSLISILSKSNNSISKRDIVKFTNILLYLSQLDRMVKSCKKRKGLI